MNPAPPTRRDERPGPLSRIRVVELSGLGALPFAGMVLADLGADVILVERTDPAPMLSHRGGRKELLHRGRRSIAIDLKKEQGAELILRLVETADILMEGFRPGVAERLKLGPQECLGRNPQLIYGRLTGWGQTGPLKGRVGHDVNYLALSGALHVIGEACGPPLPPVNFLGDFAGGGLLLVVGLLSALWERQWSSRGQVVDASILDGSALLTTHLHSLIAQGLWNPGRGSNLIDGGAPFYGVYKTKDARYLAIGALEPRFYTRLLERLGIDQASLPPQFDTSGWDLIRKRLADVFQTRSLEQWRQALEDIDVCFAPVLAPEEATHHPHNQARATFVCEGGINQPAPAPRFSRSPVDIRRPPPLKGEDSSEVLAELGLAVGEVDRLYAAGVVA